MAKEKKVDDIIVNDIVATVPVTPIAVILPESANAAQKERAEVLNRFAVQNPAKWAIDKDRLVAQLRALGDLPVNSETNGKS